LKAGRVVSRPVLLTLAAVLVNGCALTRTGSEPPPSESAGGPAYRLTVPGETGADLPVDVFEDTLSVRDARAVSKPDIVAAMETMPAEGIAALPVAGDQRSLFVAWVGLTCDEHAVITVSPGIRQIVPVPSRPGDSVVGLDVTVITEDERAVTRLSIAVLVRVE